MRRRGQKYLAIAVVLVVVMSIFILNGLVNQIPAADEMVFIRLTNTLPEYESYKEWWTLDGVTTPSDWLGYETPDPYYKRYNQPVWWHPPGANYISWPFVKILYSEGSLDTIRQGVKNLRVLAWMMITGTILCVCWLIRRSTGDTPALIVSLVPLLMLIPFFPVFGNNWFYNDTFMNLFLLTALVLRETKYKRFIYIPLTLMVSCKITGFIFLAPFVFENRKTALCSLILIPYFIQCYLGTGHFFYPFVRAYLTGEGYPATTLPYLVLKTGRMIRLWPWSWPLLITTAGLLIYSGYKVLRRRIPLLYPSLLLISVATTIFWWGGYYQLVIVGYMAALLWSTLLRRAPEVVETYA